jgi:SAM-dependent methyltransferase
MRNKIKLGFKIKSTRYLDMDASSTSLHHAKKIKKNFFLQRLYQEWYKLIEGSLSDNTGPILELGSGGGFIKEIIPDAFTSDILNIPNVDIRLDGRHLPFQSNSLAGIVMVDVFHHIPDVRMFFSEAARCVKPGGRVVMNEPWVSLWSSFVYKYLHHEPFLPDKADWRFPSSGPLSGANSALPFIVFQRDHKIFERDFPQWRIRKIYLHTPFSYLLSGGLKIDHLVPGRLFRFCRNVEKLLSPVISYTAMFALIVLEKSSYHYRL